jgi:hypothetical protein
LASHLRPYDGADGSARARAACEVDLGDVMVAAERRAREVAVPRDHVEDLR